MKRDSFIFYRSFFEAINDLPNKNQLEIYRAIASYSMDFEETELSGISKTVFKLIKPQLDANNKRFMNGCKGKDHGKKGGRPKKPLENPKETPNNNVNDNDNDNVNNNKKERIPHWNNNINKDGFFEETTEQ